MARKTFLSELGENRSSDDKSRAEQRPIPVPQLGNRGAIGAVTRSIKALQSQALAELDPDLIDEPPIVDRLDEDPASFSEFAEQIKENGQQVPILVRPHPTVEGRYQLVYGRRRLRAVMAAGCFVKAAVKPLTDNELIIAQGQENSQREDLTYIECALYASALEDAGTSRSVIMAALGIDKAALSKLIKLATSIPQEVIRAVGRAPKTGRDRWMELVRRLEATKSLSLVLEAITRDDFLKKTSDDRFLFLLNMTSTAAAKTRAPLKIWKSEDGAKPLRFKEDEKSFTIILDKKVAPDFGEFLLQSMPDLYSTFKKRSEETN